MIKVFIDGSAGTTGLKIYDRLKTDCGISLLTLSEADRKKPECRREALNECEVAFLCLPDEAARESVSLIEKKGVIVLDTSTAHRTDPAWSYGFPELGLGLSDRTAVPGCHASGFIALVYPLIKSGILKPSDKLTAFSLTGYSGGGKKMIAGYESDDKDSLYYAPRQYALSQSHKHLPEMKHICSLNSEPIFCPVVDDYFSGMEVTVPLFYEDRDAIKQVYREFYTGGVVSFTDGDCEGGFASAGAFSGKDNMEISVHGSGDRTLLIARYDNLGKGASGAAIQCMNLLTGRDERDGLII